jgi:DNA-binding response OmpR family regulator
MGALRKKLKTRDDIPDIISTEAGVGYRLLDLD